ncbi:MAG: AMP-dependent synthetase/ligase [Gammaproteobacteria bacterium]|nr:AMP-dependent synthetase/ligase [Gammaproteobacteria bacterium]
MKDVIDPQEVLTLERLFLERVRRSPAGAAYRYFQKSTGQWQQITWRGAFDEVCRWRAALAAEGLNRGDRVAVALRNCPDWVYFDIAALSLGLVVVPLYTDDRPENTAYILEDAQSRVLLIQDAKFWTRLAPAVHGDSPLQRVLLQQGGQDSGAEEDSRVRSVQEWLPGEADAWTSESADGNELASIVYTSGTTGRPKGVMLSHMNMMSVAYGGLQLVDVDTEDLFLSFLPLSHTLERTGGYYLPMMAGSCVAYSRSIAQLATDLQQIRPTLMIAVPRIFERVYGRIQQQMKDKGTLARRLFDLTVAVGWRRFCYQQGRQGWTPSLLAWPLLEKLVAGKVTGKLGGRLRLAVSGGAPLNDTVARMFISLGVPILQGYGLTETSPVISVNALEDNEPRSVGVTLPGIQVRVGDSDELIVRGPGVMLGYWNNDQWTREMIDEDGWLHTGDQARIENGHIYITGRIKDILVLSNGEKVPPGDMESAICLDELFDQAIIIGEGRPFLSAIVVLNPDAWREFAAAHGFATDDPKAVEDPKAHQLVVKRVAAQLKDFPAYARVRKVLLTLEPWTIDSGLLTPTMKVKRNLVLERFADEVEEVYEEGAVGR